MSPNPKVADVIHGVLRTVPPQPWQTYMRRSSEAAAAALTDLGLCKPLEEPKPRRIHLVRRKAEAE